MAIAITLSVVDNLSAGFLDDLTQVRDHPGRPLVFATITNRPMRKEGLGKVHGIGPPAALEGTGRTPGDPVETIATSVRGTEIVLDVCHNVSDRVDAMIDDVAEIQKDSLC